MKPSNCSLLKKRGVSDRMNRSNFTMSLFLLFTMTAIPPMLMADEPVTRSAPVAVATSVANADMRYGLFNWLDHRSVYGQDAFPEPFLVDDSALETDEARLDWVYTQSNHNHSDLIKAEIEKGFGLLTLELEIPFEYDSASGKNHSQEGFDNVNLGARYPVFQIVSDRKFVDTTFGIAIEVGIPTYSSVSKDAEVVPKIFNDLKVGEHFTLQSIFGYSKLFGSDADGGLAKFEYGFVFGYTIPHEQLPLPHVLQFTPIFELIGETELNKTAPGHNSLIGNAGFRVNLKAIGQVQPRLGLGYVFPIDNGGREDMHWGVITSLVFEY